jgi:hypothetical protein
VKELNTTLKKLPAVQLKKQLLTDLKTTASTIVKTKQISTILKTTASSTLKTKQLTTTLKILPNLP